mmetsp:Transcript_77866/g.161769  ORF Transcript_77866/g.161769 Transcript_77866/m.161769 type:complete len:404 (-) Transcript_77866:55-1266(-)
MARLQSSSSGGKDGGANSSTGTGGGRRRESGGTDAEGNPILPRSSGRGGPGSERGNGKSRAWFNPYVHHCRRGVGGRETLRERPGPPDGGTAGGSASSTAICPSPAIALAEDDPLRTLELSFLSLSGVDDSVTPRTLCDISQEYSFVEWGVNFRAEKQGMEPRYASLTWLRQLQEEIDSRQTGKSAPIQFAAHLGGEYCVDVLKGDTSLVKTLWEDYGFLRIHLCPTKSHGVNSSQLKKYQSTLKSVIVALPQVEFVLLVCKETRALAFQMMNECQPNLAFFYDAEEIVNGSVKPGGKQAQQQQQQQQQAGQLPRRPPPCPHPGIHCGYGGGLTVDNLTDELRRIAQVVKTSRRPVWVDLQSGLRTTSNGGRSDDFDLNKAWACIKMVNDLGLPRVPAFEMRR